MNKPIYDGGPVYPIIRTPGVDILESPGISLRDWFAGQIVSGIIANPHFSPNTSPLQAAAHAYATADAMLAARKEQPND